MIFQRDPARLISNAVRRIPAISLSGRHLCYSQNPRTFTTSRHRDCSSGCQKARWKMLNTNGRQQLLDISRVGAKAHDLARRLHDSIVGQDEAIAPIVQMYQTHLVGLSSGGRPIATFLFLGPTGTGKTRIVEATAEALLGNPGAVIKIDCAEFQHSHEIAKLIGSPPGYIGHRETKPVLTQEAIDQWQTDNVKMTFVLFDEIEKGNEALWQLLLGLLDKATLTLGDGAKVDLSRTVIFLTSNLGAGEMSSIM